MNKHSSYRQIEPYVSFYRKSVKRLKSQFIKTIIAYMTTESTNQHLILSEINRESHHEWLALVVLYYYP